MNDDLKDKLKRLKLPYMAEHYKNAAQNASRENCSHVDFLRQLVDNETLGKQQRLVELRMRQASFPIVKTLDTFDFAFPKKINKRQILRLFDLDFIDRKANAVFLGPSGVGKSHLALALGYRACQQGHRVLFTTAVNLINQLTASMVDASFMSAMKRYCRCALLVIDELGFLPIDKNGADLLFQVVSSRYECGSVLLTTNLPFKNWARIFNDDATLASAVADRLVHHAEVVEIHGESYRVKSKQKTRPQ
jgi:DNA replication protein DnaC